MGPVVYLAPRKKRGRNKLFSSTAYFNKFELVRELVGYPDVAQYRIEDSGNLDGFRRFMIVGVFFSAFVGGDDLTTVINSILKYKNFNGLVRGKCYKVMP